MKILWLGPYRSKLIDFIKSLNDEVFITEDPIDDESEFVYKADFLISYGYRHIIKKTVLEMFPRKAINLHISFLPWNRGADPNLWSFLEDTPKGVTIHFIDEGIDTGNILVQKEISFNNDETLRTSYQKLSREIENLFLDNWLKIRNQEIVAIPQTGTGSFHKTRDRNKYEMLLINGWDTKVSSIHRKACHGGANE